ncbi:MAG: hypothetical protein IKO74_08335 [Selenomonadaceae bacterium]|nr:hypothetical protein [Selenomonadaceae bacterium]
MITTVLCLLSVEPLANEVRDDVPDDGCSDCHEFSGKILAGQAACKKLRAVINCACSLKNYIT